jgi:hypothetical protein
MQNAPNFLDLPRLAESVRCSGSVPACQADDISNSPGHMKSLAVSIAHSLGTIRNKSSFSWLGIEKVRHANAITKAPAKLDQSRLPPW